MLAVITGSRRSSILSVGGRRDGLSTNSTVPIGLRHFVHHGGCAGDQLEVVLAFEALLHDVHVQQAQETDAEAEAQRSGNLRLVMQR